MMLREQGHQVRLIPAQFVNLSPFIDLPYL